MKVVINQGGTRFLPSKKVFEKLIEAGWSYTKYDEKHENLLDISVKIIKHDELFEKEFGFLYNFSNRFAHSKELRTNPQLILIIEKLGEEADSICTISKIADVPDNSTWTIEYVQGKTGMVFEEIVMIF